MNTRFSPPPIILAMILPLGVICTRAEITRELTLRIEQVSPEPAFSLFISGQQATNFILESSVDFKAWQMLYQSFGWPGGNSVYVIVPAMESQPYAFWRAVPGESLQAQKQRWLEKEPAEYTFRLRHMFSFWEGGVRGTVRVRNGSIAEVTDAVDDRTNQPIAQPDLSRFLTITQLFEEIGREFAAGSEQVQVRYHSSGLFPARVVIDRIIRAADDESVIEASDFVSVKP